KKTNELFALNLAKDNCSDCIILCEGYMDVIAMHQAGFKNAVAGCVTALTNEQVRLISRYTKEVILAYDADEAGQKALNKAIGLFKQTDVKVKIPALTGGKDPDEIIKKYGKDKFKGMLEGASNEIEFALLDLRKKCNLNTTQGKIDFLNGAVKVLCNVSPIEQDLYLSRLSGELGVEKSSIKLQLDDYSKKYKKRQKQNMYKSIVNNSVKENQKISFENNTSVKQMKAEERIIGLLLRYPDCRELCRSFDAEKFSSPFIKRIFTEIISRLDNALDVDLINFSGVLTNDELGRLSGIIARTRESKNAKKEFSDCMTIVNDEYDRMHGISSSQMSDDEFRKLFNNG
ncbi:MAG: toprim domain-containing protein, partial [Eubacterium sp.]